MTDPDLALCSPVSTIYDHQCTRCPLHEHAQTVCMEGDGSTRHRIMVVGEAPGSNEDRVGRPFIGQAGQMLDKTLKEAFITDLARKEAFVTNVVKCRPRGNATPTTAQIDACFPYLREEIAAVDPYVILALGNPACEVLLGETGITRLRGDWHLLDRERETWVMPTFHPAFVLYQGGTGSDAHSLFVDDVQMFAAKAIAGIENVL